MAVLDQILRGIRAGLPERQKQRPTLESQIPGLRAAPDFVASLRRPNVALIAEVKRRSPSAGEINAGLDPVRLASAYATGGAAAISVLTEGPHFGGALEDLEAVCAAVSAPVLRKDFIVDEVQLLEARVAGAAAALLIVRALTDTELRRLESFAASIGLATLVEAHDRVEVDRALAAGCRVVGVNARNLDDFTMHREVAWDLLATIPDGHLAVAESGMQSVDDVTDAAAHGADAVLIGGALASAGDPQSSAAALSGIVRRGR